MLITANIKFFSDIETLLSKLHKKRKIDRETLSFYLREAEQNSFYLQSASLLLVNTATFKNFGKIAAEGRKIGVELQDFTGWRVYDRNMWLYWKKGNGEEAKALERPQNWFRDIVCPKGKNYKLVKYSEEVEECIRKNKYFYNIGMTADRRSLNISLEEMEDFEKVIFLENQKTGTRLYYGVWS